MGLDQYLWAKEAPAPTTDQYGDTYIDMGEEDVYWRKTNFVHKFFLDAVEAKEDSNCEHLPVPVSAIKALRTPRVPSPTWRGGDRRH